MINILNYPDLDSDNIDLSSINDFLELKGSIVLEKIIKGKTSKKQHEKDLLNESKDFLLSDYKKYEENKHVLQCIKRDDRIPDETKDLLRKLYETDKPVSLKRAQQKIIELLPKELSGRCPYCRLSEYNTSDHYLDKSEYPEYSIFPLNLIPCCSKCNSKKGDKFLDLDGNRMFINFRFDTLPDYEFLFCNIECKNSIPLIKGFELRFKDNEPLEITIRHHFDELDLDNRFKEFSRNTVSTIVDILQRNKSIKSRKRALLIRIGEFERNWGKNYWEASVFRAVLHNDELLQL